METGDAVRPERGWILVENIKRVLRQDAPRSLPHLMFELPRSPSCKAGKGSERFGGLRLSENTFQNAGSTYIDPTNDQPRVRIGSIKPEEQHHLRSPDWPSSEQAMGCPLQDGEILEHVGEKDIRRSIQNEPDRPASPMFNDE